MIKQLVLVVLFCFLNTGISPQEDPYKPIVDQMPEPVGGYESIYKKIEYPMSAKKMGTQGKVYLLVYISEKGDVDEVKVVKGIGAGCDEAAAEAIKKAKFSPGKLQGSPVKVKLTVPVIFKI